LQLRPQPGALFNTVFLACNRGDDRCLATRIGTRSDLGGDECLEAGRQFDGEGWHADFSINISPQPLQPRDLICSRQALPGGEARIAAYFSRSSTRRTALARSRAWPIRSTSKRASSS